MGKSAQKVTKETSDPPQWATGLQQQGLGQAYAGIMPYLTPGYGVAGPNADFNTAANTVRGNAASTQLLDFAPMQAAKVADVPNVVAAQGTAAQIDPNDIQKNLNPYTANVVDTTLARMRGQQDQNLNDIRARQAAAHSFAGSGSRAALQTAQSTKDYNSQVASTTAQLMSAGYSQAQAAALAEAQMRQQTGLANTGYQQQANLTNAGLQQTRNLAQAGYDQSANQFNAAGTNATAASNLALKDQALKNLLGIADTERSVTQAGLSQPLQASTALAGILPQNIGGTRTSISPSTSPSTLQTILGLAGTVGGSVLGGPMGAGIGSALGTGIGSLFNRPTQYADPYLNDPLNWT